MAKSKELVKFSDEWKEAKREAKKALDAKLGTARKVVKREDQRG